MSAKLPVINLESVNLNFEKEEQIAEINVKAVGKEITKAFGENGFLYVKNHGIPEEIIQRGYEQSNLFFETLSLTEKMLHQRNLKDPFCGYLPREGAPGFKDVCNADTHLILNEKLGNSRIHEAREQINMHAAMEDSRWPDTNLLPEFKPTSLLLMNYFQRLFKRLLYLIAYGFDELEDKTTFVKAVKGTAGKMENKGCILKFCFYEKLPLNQTHEAMRCGEHTDFGLLTLLVHNALGLQVWSPENEYINVLPIPGTLVVNVGDLLQIWTDGRLKSTKHRVIQTTEMSHHSRTSIIYFGNPDDHFVIKPLFNSSQNAKQSCSITSQEYVTKKLEKVKEDVKYTSLGDEIY